MKKLMKMILTSELRLKVGQNFTIEKRIFIDMDSASRIQQGNEAEK